MIAETLDRVECRGVSVLDWTEDELAAFELPDLLPTPEWVTRHIRLPSKDAALPGRVDPLLSWYLFAPNGPLEAMDDPSTETITFVAGTQVGKSSLLDWGMCALACQHPGPQLRVLPTEPDARDVAGRSLRDLVLACEPLLARTRPTWLTREGYEFRDANWYFAWSNSPASLARRAIRYVWYDEAEKYPTQVGKESGPIDLGDARLRTYRETVGAKSVRVSSPTIEEGPIWVSYRQSDQRRFWVPCPHCGGYAPLEWSSAKWPRGSDGHSADPESILADSLAWYECGRCGGRWTNAQKNQAVRRGRWARAGERVEDGGLLAGQARMAGPHAGFHLNAIYSSFTSLSRLAWQWLKAQNDVTRLQAFVNQELGEIWQEEDTRIEPHELAGHVGRYAMGTAPAGVQAAAAFVDTQKDYFWVEVRGWGYGLESWLLEWRAIQSEAELHDFLRDRRYVRVDADGQPLGPAVEGDPPPAELAIAVSLIDSGGSRTAEVYDWVQDWQDVDLRPTKGSDALGGGLKVRATPITKSPRTRRALRRTVLLYVFDADFWKDVAARLAKVSAPGPGYLHLPADLPEAWFEQFASEHKVRIPIRGRGRRWRPAGSRSTWVPKAGHSENHAWDCAVGNCLATDEQLANLRNLPDPSAEPARPARRRIGRMDGFRGE